MLEKNIQMKHNSNGEEYNVFPKTKAELVEETSEKSFVTSDEKKLWSSKAEGNHTHTATEIGAAVIDDGNLSLSSTWSSTKTEAELNNMNSSLNNSINDLNANKADTNHLHDEYINKTGDTMNGTLIANDIEISGALKINGKRISIGSSAHSSPSSGDIWIQI